jgi:hypothetical protein
MSANKTHIEPALSSYLYLDGKLSLLVHITLYTAIISACQLLCLLYNTMKTFAENPLCALAISVNLNNNVDIFLHLSDDDTKFQKNYRTFPGLHSWYVITPGSQEADSVCIFLRYCPAE